MATSLPPPTRDDPADSGPVLKRRPLRDDSELDITPMIDITFLLLIFFLVASIPDPQTAIELSPAVSGTAVNPRTSVIVTVAEGPDGSAQIYLADGKVGQPLIDDVEAQREALLQYLQEGVDTGMTTLLVKGDRAMKTGVIHRIYVTAAEIEGLRPHLATLESDE